MARFYLWVSGDLKTNSKGLGYAGYNLGMFLQQPPPPPFPPGPPGGLPLELRTVTFMLALTFCVQAILIISVMRSAREYRGVREVVFSIFCLAAGTGILIFRLENGRGILGAISNLLAIGGHSLLYVAIRRFTNQRVQPIFGQILIPLSFIALLGSYLLIPRFPIVFITMATAFPLNIAAAFTLLRADNRRYRSSAVFTAIPLLIYALATLTRFVIGLIWPEQVLPGPSLLTLFEILVLFVTSFVWTVGFVLMINQRLQSALNEMAMFDPLTQIWNRRAMQDKLESEMRRDRKQVQSFSVILIDADRFKQVNDRFGHDVGDIALEWLAAQIQDQLRTHDMVARWGGEEFLILLPKTQLDEAMQVAERLRENVANTPFKAAPTEINITVSAGVASSNLNMNVRDLIKTADRALYIAKTDRNQVVSQDALPDVVYEHERGGSKPQTS